MNNNYYNIFIIIHANYLLSKKHAKQYTLARNCIQIAINNILLATCILAPRLCHGSMSIFMQSIDYPWHPCILEIP